ncbi:MAG: PatB family C-S lyase [Hungatella sp.]|jgi:cystathionine beta-lyase|nr:PatB family C-S lyase [Hungatella sp.]
MMERFFDEVISRRGTNCAKYDEMDAKYGEDVLHCGVADMDFRAPEPIREACKKLVEHGIFGYTNLPSCYPGVVGEWIRREYGCEVEDEWILFSPRVNIGLNMAVETFTRPGDKIIVHMPAYPALTEAVEKHNRIILESPLKWDGVRWNMNFSELEGQMDGSVKMMILCNPQNPTGRVWEEEELKVVERFCIEYDLLLLSDEIHADIVREGKKFNSVLSLSEQMKKRMVVYQSITKTFNIPGIIFSNMIIPDREMRQAMKAAVDCGGFHNPNVFAAAVIEPAYRECGAWKRELNTYLDENLRYLAGYLKEKMPLFELKAPEGTFLAWISYEKTGLKEEEICNFFLKEAKVSVYEGSHFGVQGRGYIRFNAAVSRRVLEEILDRIERAYCKVFK